MNVSLPHKARRIDFEAARDGDATAWSRASEADERDVATRDRIGGFEVRIDDGDQHDVVLVEDNESMIGYCDCDGFGFHGSGGRLAGNACAHLCLVRQIAVLDDSLIPSTDKTLDVGDADQEDEPDDATEPEVVDAETVDPDADATGDALDELPDRDDRADNPALDDPFAGALEDIDDRFVMTLGGDPYIRREGWQRLARSEGYRIRRDMVTLQSETDSTLAECEAQVIDEDDVVAEATGTAHIDAEDLAGAVGNLNELAETRAISRAMGWATGAGLSAVERDARAEYDEDRDVATDGGP